MINASIIAENDIALEVARNSRVFKTKAFAEGFFEIIHNGFALLGLTVVFAVITLTARPDLRQAGEEQRLAAVGQQGRGHGTGVGRNQPLHPDHGADHHHHDGDR